MISNVDSVEQLTLESGHTDYSGTWAFKCDSRSRYLHADSAVKLQTSVDADASWAITIAEDGKATITSQTISSKNTMVFNYAAANQTFSVTTATEASQKGSVYIYKEYK